MNRVLLVVMMIFLFEITLSSQTVVKIDNLSGRQKIEAANLLIVEDSSNLLTYSNIVNKEFLPLNELKEKLNIHSSYWAKLKLQNNTDEKKIVVLDFIEMTQIFTYYVNDEGALVENKTGWFISTKFKEFAIGSKYYSKIDVPANTTLDVYLKLYSDYDLPPKLQIFVSPQKSYLRNVFFETFLHGIFQGALLMLMFFGIFYYFIARDKSYGFFIAFMLFFSVFFLNHYRVLDQFFDTLKLTGAVMYWLIFPALLFYLNFSRLYLNIKKEMPKLNNVLKKTIYLGIIAAIISLASIFITYSTFLLIVRIYIVYYAIVFSMLIVAGFKIKNKISGYYLKGAFFFVLGGLTAFLGAINVIDFNLSYLEIGLLGQFFFFTIGLQYKIQQEREKAHKKMIEQLEENDILQTKVNRELEQKVNERTQEILSQNEEIRAQSERLLSANVEITSQRDDIQEKSMLLEVKNKQITDSILYARRIQNAIFGDINEIVNNFKDAFILLRPHSIVSGDFYWYSNIDNYKIVIAADCTGHGVPGAFMTVMGHDLLEDIVSKNKVVMPDKILDELDKKVLSKLKGQSAKNQIDDGMDIAVLTIDESNKTVWFAGAHSPLYYVINNEFKVTRGSRCAIGGQDLYRGKSKTFELNEIKYNSGDKFYIFSDGFQDQFGGENFSKFLTKNFKKLIEQISVDKMSVQKQILNDKLDEWTGEKHQTDDVLVIGIEL